MFNSANNKPTLWKVAVAATFMAALACAPLAMAQEHEHGSDVAASKEVTGEVVDMMCYVDHNAVGEKHGQSCGAKCIKSGGPVGIVNLTWRSEFMRFENHSGVAVPEGGYTFGGGSGF